MASAVPDDIAADEQRQLASQLLAIESELARVTLLDEVHRRALDMVLELIKDVGQTHGRVGDAVRHSLNQAWFDHLLVDEDEGLIQVTDRSRTELTQALQGAVGRLRPNPRTSNAAAAVATTAWTVSSGSDWWS